MDQDVSPVRMRAMFPEINSLPRAQGEFAFDDGHAQVHTGQHGPDVGGHIIIALGVVLEERVSIRHQPGKESFQVVAHFGVSIFLNEQGG